MHSTVLSFENKHIFWYVLLYVQMNFWKLDLILEENNCLHSEFSFDKRILNLRGRWSLPRCSSDGWRSKSAKQTASLCQTSGIRVGVMSILTACSDRTVAVVIIAYDRIWRGVRTKCESGEVFFEDWKSGVIPGVVRRVEWIRDVVHLGINSIRVCVHEPWNAAFFVRLLTWHEH